MLGDALALFNFIRQEIESSQIIQAHFTWDGKKVSGNEHIQLSLSSDPHKNTIWFFHVKSYEKYIFVPIPVNPMVHTDYGKHSDSQNPSSEYFRYVSSPLSKFTSGGEENLKTDFFIFGYLPESLMNLRKVS